jgi:hypothetical protein
VALVDGKEGERERARRCVGTSPAGAEGCRRLVVGERERYCGARGAGHKVRATSLPGYVSC